MTHVDLFSGIGGFALAAQWAGFRTVAFCEIDPFCQEVLKERFGAVADAANDGLHNVGTETGISSGESFNRESSRVFRPILIPDIRALDGTRFRGATLLTGGFPCQPFSVAGKRKGKEDTRHLWPEMLRVIHEAKPTWVIGENVGGFVNMALDEVCLDLEGEGYEVWPLVIPACAVNAPHRRDRVWIIAKDTLDRGGRVGEQKEQGNIGDERDAIAGDEKRIHRAEDADAPQNPIDGRNGRRGDGDSGGLRRALQTQGSNSHAPHAAASGRGQGNPNAGGTREGAEPARERRRPPDVGWDTPWPEVAARLCRMDDGLPAWIYRRRTERLKALGNSIVPAVAFQIIKAIAEIESAHVPDP